MPFFGSMMGDFDDIAGHMRQMNRMMNSFFTFPFGGMAGGMGGSTDLMPRRHGMNAMMPFGFPDMDNLFNVPAAIESNGNNCHSFTSSTVMAMTNGPDGRPQVYQASQSVRSGPGGVRETKKTVADSRSGVKKMAIGHHIGERAHIMEREQNYHSGVQEEHEEFINLEEEEAGEFNREWEQKTRNYSTANAINYPSSSARYGSRHHRDLPMLPASSQSSYRSSRPRLHARRSNNLALPPPSPPTRREEEEEEAENDVDDSDDDNSGVKIVELDSDDEEQQAEEEKPEVMLSNNNNSNKIKRNAPSSSRKRECEPDVHYNKRKVQKVNRDSN